MRPRGHFLTTLHTRLVKSCLPIDSPSHRTTRHTTHHTPPPDRQTARPPDRSHTPRTTHYAPLTTHHSDPDLRFGNETSDPGPARVRAHAQGQTYALHVHEPAGPQPGRC